MPTMACLQRPPTCSAIQADADSFKGIGHITFLKLYPLFRPRGAESVVEIICIDNLHVAENVSAVVKEGDLISVYAEGNEVVAKSEAIWIFLVATRPKQRYHMRQEENREDWWHGQTASYSVGGGLHGTFAF